MKVLMINGSPRVNGNTSLALDEMTKIFEENGKTREERETCFPSFRGGSPKNKGAGVE